MVSRETFPDGLPSWLIPTAGKLAEFAELLSGPGVERGLIGPREVARLWPRHLLNCAAVADPAANLVPADSVVADVGSGAGLPGLVWAIARPDIRVILIEPLLRRSTFLTEAVEILELSDRVDGRRDRAEDVARDDSWIGVDVVTARAVAPLERLLGWTVPLLRLGGHLVALKGTSAPAEVLEAASAAHLLGVHDLRVTHIDAEYLDQPTTVILGVRRAAE
jgi:16S rRNA (guanine527-N7)-methyltransferase